MGPCSRLRTCLDGLGRGPASIGDEVPLLYIPKSFTCKACKSLLSHPIDACPICGDQFYWLVEPKGELSQAVKDHFVRKMEQLVEGKASREFLTHGGFLWLPHRFWDFDAEGESLADLDWAVRLELFQHENTAPEQSAKARTAEATKKPRSAWDTIPKAPLPHFAQVRQAVQVEREGKRPGFAAPAPPSSAPAPPAAAPAESFVRGSLIPAPLFAPLMVLAFFLFLSLSYLVLRYHKNTRPVSLPAASAEVANESALLP